MLKKFLSFLFFIIMFTSCSNNNPKIKINSIICFGDSLTEGVGATNNQTYPYFLQQQTSIPVINSGIRGNTSQDGLNRIDTLNNVKDSLVIIEFGANDFFQQVPLFQTKKNIETIIDKLQDNGATIVLASTEDKQLHNLYTMLKSVAKEKNVLFIDGILNEIWNDQTLFSDEIHPNSNGYNLVAEKIYNNIKNLIE